MMVDLDEIAHELDLECNHVSDLMRKNKTEQERLTNEYYELSRRYHLLADKWHVVDVARKALV